MAIDMDNEDTIQGKQPEKRRNLFEKDLILIKSPLFKPELFRN